MLKIQVIGNLGQDAVIREHNSNQVISFPVAHNKKFTDSDGVTHESTTWIRCSMWRNQAGIAKYLKKGTQIYVEGYPEVKLYKALNGEIAASLDLTVVAIYLLGFPAGKEPAKDGSPDDAAPQQPAPAGSDGDDLPF